MIQKKKNYKIHTFTDYHDAKFIDYAYEHILQREADTKGKQRYLDFLRTGSKTKLQILTLLHFSEEGQQKQIHIIGLKKYHIFHMFLTIPVLGQILRFFAMLIHLPSMLKQMQKIVANQQRMLYAIEQIDNNFQWTSNSIETLASIIDTRASDEDIKMLYHILSTKIDKNTLYKEQA